MRSRFPDNAAFATMASRWHDASSVGSLALADAVVGSALDGSAAEPRFAAAGLLLDMGERALSYRYGNAALLRAPHEPGATLRLASLAMRERLDRAIDAGTLGDFAPAVEAPGPQGSVEWAIEDTLLEPLTRWLADAALDVAPDQPTGRLARGDDAALSGDWASAIREYRGALERADGWFAPRLRLAFALETVDPAESRVHLEALVAQAQLPPTSWAAVVGLAGRLGDLDLARVATEAAVDVLSDPEAPVRALFGAVRAATRSEPRAARALESLVASRPSTDAPMYAAVGQLTDASLTGFAVAILRGYLQRVPDDAGALFQLARAIARTPADRAEAIELLERARELAPWAPILTVELGWLLVNEDPLRVRSMLASLDSWDLGATALALRAAEIVGEHTDVASAQARLEAMCGSPVYVSLAIAQYHIEFDRGAEGMAITFEGEPHPEDVEGAVNYMRVLRQSGRMTQAVEFIAAHPEFESNQSIAQLIAVAGDATHQDVVRRLAHTATRSVTTGAWSATYAVESLCLDGRFADAVARAGDDAWALARLAEWAPDHATRLGLAQRAFALAPEDRMTLAAWHSVLMDAGRLDEAFRVAKTLVEDFPYEHQAAERMAECELYVGDLDEAERWAQTAISEGPTCARAWAAAALVAAVRGDWDAVDADLKRREAVSRPLRVEADADPVDLVAAALLGDRDRYESHLANVRLRAPGLPLERLTAACEARLGVS
jgi:tetratricopeptide (TPR) repeat protein